MRTIRTFRWLLSVLITGLLVSCEPQDKQNPSIDLTKLGNTCLKVQVLSEWRCTSGVYVQVLNAPLGNTATYDGKDYDNVILINNLPASLNLGPNGKEPFYFTVDQTQKTGECTEYFPCLAVMIGPAEPTPVSVRVCGSNFSTTACPASGG